MTVDNKRIQKIINRIIILVPEAAEENALLEQLVNDAFEFVAAYTRRNVIPETLDRTIGDLAIVAYNRRGTEGEAGRTEGGESYSFESAPAQIFDVLRNYRLARVGGKVYEKEAANNDKTVETNAG